VLTTKYFHIHYHEIPDEYSYIQNKYSKEEYEKHPLFDAYSFGRVINFIFFNSIFVPNVDEIEIHPFRELLKNILFLITMCMNIDPDERPVFA
jgi:hypothetical protein